MSNLSGLLSTDALGLWVVLQKTYSSEDLIRFSEWYRNSWQDRGCHEPEVRRTPGASFNPRPARLAQLLIDSAPPALPADLIGCALLLPGRIEGASLSPDLGSRIEMVRCFRRTGQLADLTLSGTALLAFAVVLDDVRHTHMIEDPAIRSEWWNAVAPVAETLTTCKELSQRQHQQLFTALRLQQRNIVAL